jgi:hypothetical protein
VRHYLKTGFGTSTSSYTSDALFRIYGVGQGSKAGPVTWAVVSSLLFEAQDILGTGVSFQNPTHTIAHHRNSDGMVDDTTGYHGRQPQWIRQCPSIHSVFKGLKKDAQTWERLLWTSGGLLELSKCRFYIVYWKFQPDGRSQLLSKAELDTPTLLLTEGKTGAFQEIAQLDIDEPFKTLGIHKTISGDQTVQVATLKAKSDTYARGILSVNVTYFEAWTGLFSIWLGQMSYVLVATFLTRGECEKIQSKAVNVSLTKCGFRRTTSRSIVFGSPWFGGLGWRHLFFEQGIQHVLLMIKHLRTPGHFQSLLIICLHWYQVVAGVSFCPFSRPRARMPYLGSAWLDSTRAFLAHSAATLHIEQASLPALQRQHDACIMDGIIELGLSTTSLERINCCRIYLRVTTLSDICTLHGDQIERKAWLGLGRMASSQADWPVQPRPHDKSWGLWRSALSKSVCTKEHRYVLASRPGILIKRLGLWLNKSTPQTSPRWTALFEHSTQ